MLPACTLLPSGIPSLKIKNLDMTYKLHHWYILPVPYLLKKALYKHG